MSCGVRRRILLRLPRLENWRDALALCLLLAGLQQLSSAGYIQLKAGLAQVLIKQAWGKTVDNSGAPTRPWPWADTWPVARMSIRSQALELYVLAGSRGNALAFGPGYEAASAPLGSVGSTVIGGHRDTHFAFLENLEDGELLLLELPSGELLHYQVVDRSIVDTDSSPGLKGNSDLDELLLVTCYPFDAVLPGGPLRYVVTARRHPLKIPAGTASGPHANQGAYAL
jgi:sortase A